jgi:hypothetical protein
MHHGHLMPPHMMNHGPMGVPPHYSGPHPPPLPYPMDPHMLGYRYGPEMNDDSYSTDNMENENDSESVLQHGSENMKPIKK